jgi:hypothetical protein
MMAKKCALCNNEALTGNSVILTCITYIDFDILLMLHHIGMYVRVSVRVCVLHGDQRAVHLCDCLARRRQQWWGWSGGSRGSEGEHALACSARSLSLSLSCTYIASASASLLYFSRLPCVVLPCLAMSCHVLSCVVLCSFSQWEGQRRLWT